MTRAVGKVSLWRVSVGFVHESQGFEGFPCLQFIEYCTIKEYGPEDWLTAWNFLDILAYTAQVMLCEPSSGTLGATPLVQQAKAVAVVVICPSLPQYLPFEQSLAASKAVLSRFGDQGAGNAQKQE